MISEIITIYFSAFILAGFVFFLHFLYHRKFGLPNLTFKDSLDGITPEIKKYLIDLKRRRNE
jgi:hypothetical protein